MDDSNPRLDKAIWRYGIICSLLHRQANDLTLSECLDQLADRKWRDLQGLDRQFSPETLRKWLYRYQNGGLPALQDQDKLRGTHIPETLANSLCDLRRQHPRWTVKRLLDQCLENRLWNGTKPSRATLYRFIKAHNLHRDPHLQASPRAFQFDAFGQLWLADFMHGCKLRQDRRKLKTYLHAILDDHSRYVVAAQFYTQETVESLFTDLMAAVRRFGIPQRFYTDNGAAYASRHLKLVCARLGIQLVHTPPYRPQGRGKVERFFRTVRDQFLAETHFQSVDQLQSAFNLWLAEYHRHLHSGHGKSPLQARLQAKNVCNQVPEVTPLDALFLMERRCRVYRNGTIRLFRRSFEVPGCLPGERVKVFYMPWNLDQVSYGPDLKPARALDLSANAYRFRHPSGGSS